MCTNVVETIEIIGGAKGRREWMTVDRASVAYDHPCHASVEHAVIIDLVISGGEPGDRVAIELSTTSARDLVSAIVRALQRAGADGA